ncbi:MAG TPA: hypothetical protein VH877_02435 [Polyangia bacterium]|nr:hypothetical protein [Polyangia bacterium]
MAPRDLKDPWAAERPLAPPALASELKSPWTEAAVPAHPLAMAPSTTEMALKPIWSKDEDEEDDDEGAAPPVQLLRAPVGDPTTDFKSPWGISMNPVSPAPCGDKK